MNWPAAVCIIFPWVIKLDDLHTAIIILCKYTIVTLFIGTVANR